MSTEVLSKTKLTTSPAISRIAARCSFAASVTTLVILVVLHILSPEFDPAWRMVSEYALGNYAWVLSIMFIAWAFSSWALAFTLWPHLSARAGKVGMFFLITAGLGEAMASVFDIQHPLHSVAAMIGILSLPIAAVLISRSLGNIQEWSPARGALRGTAALTWISLVLMAATFILLIVTYTQAGGEMTSEVAVLPPGVIALVGWANRLLIVMYCVWALTVARYAMRVPESHVSGR